MSHKCVLPLHTLQLKVKGFVYFMKYYHMIALVYIVKHLSFYQWEDKKELFVLPRKHFEKYHSSKASMLF